MKTLYLCLRLRYLEWRYRKIRDHLRLLKGDLSQLVKEIEEIRRAIK